MIDPVAFTIRLWNQAWDIHWYGIIMAVAMLVGIFLVFILMKRAGLDADLVYDLALVVVPLAIIGARAYYVIFEWNNYYRYMDFWEIFKIWHGGLAIYGGVIGGLVGILVFCKWKKISFAKIVDVVSPALILGQAIGRWGNFINSEAYGYAVDNPAFHFFPATVFIAETGRYHLATFFYESMWNLLVFAFLMLYFYGKILKRRKRVDGDIFALYLTLYGFGRFFIEGMRTDSLYLFGTIRVSQLLSGLLVILGVLYFVFQKKILAYLDNRKSAKQVVMDMQQSGELPREAEAADEGEIARATIDIHVEEAMPLDEERKDEADTSAPVGEDEYEQMDDDKEPPGEFEGLDDIEDTASLDDLHTLDGDEGLVDDEGEPVHEDGEDMSEDNVHEE